MEQRIIDRALELLGRAGAPALDAARVKLLAEFLAEVERWGARVHLVGKGDVPGTVSALVLDSFLLNAAAGRAGLFGGANGAPGGAEGGGFGVAESGTSIFAAKGGPRVADIGSGAGFPGVIWKIVSLEHKVTLFERREKQQIFLERIVAKLSLDGLHLDGRDAAAAATEEPFDIVISKASGRLPVLLPLAARLLREGGSYCTTKGRRWREELDAAGESGMRLENVEELPFDRGFIIAFRKIPAEE